MGALPWHSVRNSNRKVSVNKAHTGDPRLVQILGPGKNRTSEIRTSEYYIANFR